MKTDSIGIIGGGVSGLAAAYELRRNAIKTRTKLQIHIFEKQADIGGNADTVVVNLGQWQDAEHVSGSYHRWADMGVNDINLTAYVRIDKIMKEIGYFDKANPGLHPKLMPLENTETYFNWDASILLTDDAELEHGVSNPEFAISKKYKGKLTFWLNVFYKAANAKVGEPGKLNLETTVGEFFNAVIKDPEKTLKCFVDHAEDVDWHDPKLKQILTEIRDNLFYPRISAMYFANDYGPETMLLAAPMCYYRIQEGIGSKNENAKADRRYFVGGANRWLIALLDNLRDTEQHGGNYVTVHFHHDFSAKVTVTTNSIQITQDNGNESHIVDRCIVTVHADDAAALLNFDYSGANAAELDGQLREHEVTVIKMLQSISYTRSTAVCHTYSGLLPSNRNQWRSYNVLIRQGTSLKPYSMTYLCNRHQNDVKGIHSREYNQVGLPQFFVTLNPLREIPGQYVLHSVDASEISSDLKTELPQFISSTTKDFVHGRMSKGDPAVVHFKHNLIDKKCFIAQHDLLKYHESAKTLYFGGGWSNGSGLHEECWQQAERVAKLIIPVTLTD